MAAAYAFHIAENQAFFDGNKRTALVSTLVFLDINGCLILDDEMKLYDAMIAIANKAMDKVNLRSKYALFCAKWKNHYFQEKS